MSKTINKHINTFYIAVASNNENMHIIPNTEKLMAEKRLTSNAQKIVWYVCKTYWWKIK